MSSGKLFRLLLPAAALLVALAWPAHVLAADRTAADLGCQVSVLALSSECNSDNAQNLLERPETIGAASAELSLVRAPLIFQPAFLGRAPPNF